MEVIGYVVSAVVIVAIFATFVRHGLRSDIAKRREMEALKGSR